MSCDLSVQSSRPVYGSTYNTTVFNFRDTEVEFNYTEQDRLEYMPGMTPDNNLTAILAYYRRSFISAGTDSSSARRNASNDSFSSLGAELPSTAVVSTLICRSPVLIFMPHIITHNAHEGIACTVSNEATIQVVWTLSPAHTQTSMRIGLPACSAGFVRLNNACGRPRSRFGPAGRPQA